MNAIKTMLIVACLLPNILFGQQQSYPKDTIYLKFKDTVFSNYKMKSKSRHVFKGNQGVKFWWNKRWLFYNEKDQIDTLSIKHLKEYVFSNNVEEIRKAHNRWIDKKFKNSKYKPYNGYFNSSFQTYLIEVISKDFFVKYPVIWRNEGAIE